MNLLKKSLLLVIAVSLSVPFLVGCSGKEELDSISTEEDVLEEDLGSQEDDDELDSEEDEDIWGDDN